MRLGRDRRWGSSLVAVGVLGALLGCSKQGLSTATIGVGEHSVVVEVAYTHTDRQRGLMYRDGLAADRGMLFVYPDTEPRSFWMKNVRFPLAIAFADADGAIVRIDEMRPYTTESTPSLYPAMYALEMNTGWFAAHGVEVGDTLTGLPEVSAE